MEEEVVVTKKCPKKKKEANQNQANQNQAKPSKTKQNQAKTKQNQAKKANQNQAKQKQSKTKAKTKQPHSVLDLNIRKPRTLFQSRFQVNILNFYAMILIFELSTAQNMK